MPSRFLGKPCCFVIHVFFRLQISCHGFKMIVEPIFRKALPNSPNWHPCPTPNLLLSSTSKALMFFFRAEKMRRVKILDRTSRMLVHISVYIEDVYMNVKIHMIHSIYILVNDCICNMHISRYLHTPLHKHNCIHAYLEAICPLILGSNPCFFPINKKGHLDSMDCRDTYIIHLQIA